MSPLLPSIVRHWPFPRVIVVWGTYALQQVRMAYALQMPNKLANEMRPAPEYHDTYQVLVFRRVIDEPITAAAYGGEPVLCFNAMSVPYNEHTQEGGLKQLMRALRESQCVMHRVWAVNPPMRVEREDCVTEPTITVLRETPTMTADAHKFYNDVFDTARVTEAQILKFLHDTNAIHRIDLITTTPTTTTTFDEDVLFGAFDDDDNDIFALK